VVLFEAKDTPDKRKTCILRKIIPWTCLMISDGRLYGYPMDQDFKLITPASFMITNTYPLPHITIDTALNEIPRYTFPEIFG
ncbi:Hypothetical protein HVR_LOCUS924, partial [uncultured virus]